MLNIYIGERNLPRDKELIRDNESYFFLANTQQSEFVDRVLRDIEKAEYFDTESIIDRFGHKLYWDLISTGSKTLININSHIDKVFYGAEMGQNAVTLLLYLKEGNVYFEEGTFNFDEPEDYPIEKVCVNGIVCDGTYQIYEAVDYGYIE